MFVILIKQEFSDIAEAIAQAEKIIEAGIAPSDVRIKDKDHKEESNEPRLTH
jgi:hypothetical protein